VCVRVCVCLRCEVPYGRQPQGNTGEGSTALGQAKRERKVKGWRQGCLGSAIVISSQGSLAQGPPGLTGRRAALGLQHSRVSEVRGVTWK